MRLVLVICAIVLVVSALVLWACIAMSGECSRREENGDA